jgi:hypothetical protein
MTAVKLVDIGVRDIRKRSRCIVRFNCPIGPSDIKPGLFFEVTVDPARISGEFIRFGKTFEDRDELTGWQPLDFIRVCHVIAEENEEGGLDIVEPEGLGITIIN